MGTRAAPLQNATDVNTPPEGLLTNLGEIALKMSEQITNSEDETLNVPQLSEFVKALSKATVLITHPEVGTALKKHFSFDKLLCFPIFILKN